MVVSSEPPPPRELFETSKFFAKSLDGQNLGRNPNFRTHRIHKTGLNLLVQPFISIHAIHVQGGPLPVYNWGVKYSNSCK